jgi:hypothetical protein
MIESQPYITNKQTKIMDMAITTIANTFEENVTVNKNYI